MDGYKGGLQSKTMAIILLFIITSMALSVFIKIVTFGKKIQKRVVTSMW